MFVKLKNVPKDKRELYEKRLLEAGYSTVESLAIAKVNDLVAVGLTEAVARQAIRQAQDALGLNAFRFGI